MVAHQTPKIQAPILCTSGVFEEPPKRKRSTLPLFLKTSGHNRFRCPDASSSAKRSGPSRALWGFMALWRFIFGY
jgi:hypothetical protein